MKKNLFLLLIGLIIGFSGFSQTPVFINPPTQNVSPSEVFTTTVEISSVTNLGGYELDVAFDPSLLQCNSITIGAFLGSTGRMVFPLTNLIDNTNGLASFAATTLGANPPGPDGDGILITLEWTATASVSENEIVDLLLQNLQLTEPNGTLIPSTTTDGTVTILGPLNTEVESQTTCPGSVIVPIRVSKFENITAFDITLDYTAAELTYVNYQNADAGLIGLTVTDNGNSITMTYTGVAATIANGSTLLELEFTAPAGFTQVVSNLSWDEASSSYTDTNGPVVATYTNGTITIDPVIEDAGAITGLTPICQGLNGEAYNITAITNASSYVWELSPATAGTINGSGTDITIDFSATFDGQATLSVYGVNACANGTPASLVIDIAAMPTADAGANETICEDIVYSLAGTATNQQSVLWTTVGDGSFDDATSLTANYTPGANDISGGSIELTLTAVAIAPCATDATGDMILTFVELPVADAGTDAGICEDPNYTLSGTASNQQSVLWITSGDGSFDDATILAATYTPGTADYSLGSATLTLTATAVAPCGVDASDDMILTVGTVPSANAGSDETICENETYALTGTASNQQSILWTTSGDGTFDDATSLTAVYTHSANDLAAGTVSLTLTATEIGPCVTNATDDIVLTFVELPTANAGSDAGICEDPNYTLSGTAANQQSVLWITSGDGSFDDATILAATYTPGTADYSLGSATLTFTAVAIAPCGDASDDMVLSIGTVPSANAGSDETICENETYALTGAASNQQSVLWTTSGDGTFDDATSLTTVYTHSANDLAAGTVTLTLTATEIEPCVTNATDNMVLTFIELPTANAGSDETICENETYALTGTASNQQSILWATSGDGTFDDATSLTAVYTHSTNDLAAGTVTLTLTATEIGPCITNATDDIVLTFIELPTANASSDAGICEDPNYTLSGIAANQQSVLWITSGDGSFDDATILAATYTPGTADYSLGSATLTLTATAVAPCGVDASDEMILTIGTVPSANAGSDETICENETYALTGTASNQQSILWTTSGDGTFDDATSLTAVYTHSANDLAAGTVSLTLTATEIGPCATNATDDITLSINPLPTVPITVSASEMLIYPGESSIISYTLGSGDTFNWYTSSCGGTLLASGNNITVSPITTTTYYGRWENSCGVSSCEEVTVTVDYHNETIQVSPATQLVSTAEVFTTEIEILQVNNLGGFELELAFDPALLQANSITLESFLGSTGRPILPLQNDIDNVSGLIEYAVSTSGATPAGPDGDGILLTIEWTSTNSVPDDITTNLILQNLQVTTPNGTLIPTNVYNGEVTIIGAVTTKVISATTCPGSVIIPIEVTSFKDVTDFSLNLDYLPAELTYASHQNVNALLTGVTVTNNGTSLTMAYSGAATTIANGSTLLELEFTAPANTAEVISNLTWDLANSSYTDDDDMDVSFYDGTVTIDPIPEDAENITGITPVCQGLSGEAYSIGAITHATSYTWDLNPATAGTIAGSGTDITIDFAAGYSGNATLSVYASNVCGDGVPSSLAIEVIAYPTVAAGDDATICADVSYTLAATATDQQSILWTTSGDGSFDDATSLTAIYTAGPNDIAAGTATLNILATAIVPCAIDVNDDMVLTIQRLPMADAGADDAICEDVTYTLAGNATDQQSVLWTTSGDGSFDDATSLIAIYNPGTSDVAAGSATLTLTAAAIGPCGTDDVDNMILSIIETPTADAGDDNVICVNATYTLSGIVNNEQSSLWTTSGDGSFDDPTSLTATYTPGANDITNGTVDLTLTAFAIAPCAVDASDDMTLLVQNLPTVDAGADDAICEYNTYTLSATAQNYQSALWTTSGDGSFDDATSLTAVYTYGANDLTNGSATLTLTVDSPCGATASDDMILDVQGAATVEAGDDAIICDIETHILSGTATYQQSVLWTTAGDGSFDDATIVNATYTPGAADITNEGVVLTITATAIAPCATDVSDDMTLSIYGVPTADAGDDATICEDGDYTLNGVATNYVTLLWTTSGDGAFDDAGIVNATYTPGDTDIANETVVLNLYTATPCGANANDDMTLSISGLPFVSAGADGSVCENATYTLSGIAENPQAILWSTSGDGTFDDAASLSATYDPSSNDIAAGEVILTLTITPIAPCGTDVVDDMILTIEELPTVDAGPNGLVCEDASYSLSGSATNYESVLWATAGDGIFDDPTSKYAIYTPGTNDLAISHAILTLTAFAITPCGTDAVDDMVLSIMGLPTADAGANATICGDETYALSGIADNEHSTLWTTSGDGSFDDAEDLEAIYTPGNDDMATGEAILTLTVNGITPCSIPAVDEMVLTVDPIVTEVSLPDGPTFVDSYYTPNTEYTSNSLNADEYTWHISPSSAGNITGSSSTETVIWNEDFQGLAYISVTASNDCNSMTSYELEVLVDNTVGIGENTDNNIQVNVVPNPNDGLFKVNIIGIQGDIDMYIINSNGAIIKHEKLINTNASLQDINFDLNKVSRGVYYIKLINNDQVFIKKLIIN